MKRKVVIIYLLNLLSSGLLYAQVSQAPLQNFISAGGGTGAVHATTSVPTHFSSVGQPAVYARPVSTNNGGGVMIANEFMFTISDGTPPVITDNTSSSVNEGASITITANISDGESAITSAQVEYRAISVGSSNVIKNLTPSGSTYSTTILASEIGELGIIYKISATSSGGTSTTGVNFKIVKLNNGGLVVPYTAFGGAVSNYRIVAIPLELSSKSLLSVFDELGGVDKEKWRMFRYDNGTTSELSGSSEILPGQGFWLIVRNNPGGSINSGPGASVSTSPSAPFEIDLKADWNQIGNPYNFNLSWADVQAANPGLPGLRIYDGDFADGTRLDKMQGGFVKVTSAQKLKFPVVKNTSVNGRTNDQPAIAQNPLTHSDWQVELQLQQGVLTNRISGFGMNKNASDGFDQFDGFNMPRFFDMYLRLNHDKKEGGDFYSKDIVPTSDDHVWNFFVESSSDEQTMKLNWVNTYFGKNEKELYLIDVNQQRAVDMRKVTSYEFNKDHSASFKIVFGGPDFVKNEILVDELIFHSVWPSPADGDVTFSFSLPESPSPQLIEFSVVDVLGRKTWSHASDYEAGYHEVTWKRDNNEASGIYFVRLQSEKTMKQTRVVLK